MEFKVGQVLNCRYPNLYGKLIAIKNKYSYGETGYTHSAIIIDIYEDEVLVAEALTKQFSMKRYEKWWLEAKIKEGIINIGTPTKPLKNIVGHALKYKDGSYGWGDIYNILIYWIKGKESIFHKKYAGVKYVICSEAVARILYDASDKKIDFEKEFKKSYDIIEPMDLARSKQIRWLHA